MTDEQIVLLVVPICVLIVGIIWVSVEKWQT